MNNMFLSILPIKGQSTVTGYKDQIEVLSWNHGISQNVTTSVSNQTRTTGRPMHSDFSFTKILDASSCEIMDYLNKGEDVKTAIFTQTQSDGTTGKVSELWKVTMANAIFTSMSYSSAGEIHTESVTMNYATIKWEFKPQLVAAEKKGTHAAGWDLTKNTQDGKAS